MVWDFIWRRRRVRGGQVAPDTVSGHYRRREEDEEGTREEQYGTLISICEEGQPRTWETLKRLGRQASQVVRGPSHTGPGEVVERREGRGGEKRRRPLSHKFPHTLQRREHQYQSTPVLFQLGGGGEVTQVMDVW